MIRRPTHPGRLCQQSYTTPTPPSQWADILPPDDRADKMPHSNPAWQPNPGESNDLVTEPRISLRPCDHLTPEIMVSAVEEIVNDACTYKEINYFRATIAANIPLYQLNIDVIERVNSVR